MRAEATHETQAMCTRPRVHGVGKSEGAKGRRCASQQHCLLRRSTHALARKQQPSQLTSQIVSPYDLKVKCMMHRQRNGMRREISTRALAPHTTHMPVPARMARVCGHARMACATAACIRAHA